MKPLNQIRIFEDAIDSNLIKYLLNSNRRSYVLVLVLLLSSCHLVHKHKTSKPKSKSWKNIAAFQDFVSPWNEQPFGKTTFQYQNDADWFYFLFEVEDKDIQICDSSLNEESNVLQSDRVELFFAKDSLMQPYFTFEMDVANRMFDARCVILANNKKGSSKQINSDWKIDKKDLKFIASQIRNGYKIEGKIAMRFLQEKQLIKHNKLWCGTQRADYNTNEPVQWICAKDPKTPKPDFHCWGVFVELTIDHRE